MPGGNQVKKVLYRVIKTIKKDTIIKLSESGVGKETRGRGKKGWKDPARV